MLPPGRTRLDNVSDWVGRGSHHDGDRGDRSLQRRQGGSQSCDDDIDLQSHELSRIFGNSLVIPPQGPPLDDVILFIDITKLTHALHEPVVRARISVREPAASSYKCITLLLAQRSAGREYRGSALYRRPWPKASGTDSGAPDPQREKGVEQQKVYPKHKPMGPVEHR